MRTKPQFFDSVRAASERRWEQIERDPELGGAWWLLFRQVQNPRHVLSELLQNADDAGATEASVSIEDGWFIFRHNGHDFTEDEFRSLCRFGFSNKRRLLTIGFRGIGFKSSFSLGPTAEVLTPTISIGFARERFTQPEWITTDERSEWTTVRVKIESPEKQTAIQAQIDGWTRSAMPLLFFQSIRSLRLADKEVRIEKIRPGPCGNSEEVRLSGLQGSAIVFRSESQPFPPTSLEEIRAERSEEIDLPPCEVVVVLSAADQQRLYCVLPTDVTVELPFSCHAPFVQDPARTGIKDPSISPTNSWLLGRIGKLAAEALVAWIGREDLSSAERAKAYGLLPDLAPLNSGLLSGATSQRVLDAFRERISHEEKILLCEGGKLDSRLNVARLPIAAIEAWGAEAARTHFRPTRRSVLSRKVSAASRSKLEAWQFLEAASFDSIFDTLADEGKPIASRPERLEALAWFWTFLRRNFPERLVWSDWWEKAAIVPLSGRRLLGRAKETLPTRARPAECPEIDWQFLVDRADILDEGWRDLLEQIEGDPSEARRRIENQLGCRLKDKALAGVLEGYRETKLDQVLQLDQIFAQVARKVFATTPDLAEAVKFTQLAARLNVAFAEAVTIKFLCIDGQWRDRSNDLVVNTELDLVRLLPECWLSSHMVSPEYERSLSPPEIAEWRGWALKPDRCGLTAFALPARTETSRSRLDPRFFRIRNIQMPSVGSKAKKFQIIDWNWIPEIWEHWRKLEQESDASFWGEIGWAVVKGWSDRLGKRLKAEIHEYGYRRVHQVPVDVPATWLHEMRSRPCIVDSRGKVRFPAELLRRNPDTAPLLDVEAFVHDRWDSTESRRALEVLGVRGEAIDASGLLERVRALSQAAEPPMGPLRDLYRAIEKILPRLPEVRERAVLNAFAVERLIRTEADWERSGFCFRDNPGGIPGVSILHPDIRDVIGLWERLKIASQPSAVDALRWLTSLALNTSLSDPVRSATRRVLSAYPQEAWNCEKRWVNLQGRLVTTSELRWGCLDAHAIPGLFASVRNETADFSMLDPIRIRSLAAVPPKLLDTTIERRILGHVHVRDAASGEQVWVHALGQVLARIQDRDASQAAAEADRQSGERLMSTKWIPVEIVRVQPFLNGVPVGSEEELPIAWIGEGLYVRGDSVRGYKLIVQEISRYFVGEQARSAIRDCVGRDPEWIWTYAEEYLDLSVRPPLESCGTTPPESKVNGESVFPVKSESEVTGAESEAKGNKRQPGRKRDIPKGPLKRDRLENFLTSHGFDWDSNQDKFIHPDGTVVRRSETGFPWELIAAGRVKPLWPAQNSLSDQNGIEIPAEIWNAAKRCEAVLLEPDGDTYREWAFSAIRARVEARDLDLYTSTYRIRVAEE